MIDYSAAIERVYEHVENDDVGKAAMACLRLARHTRDYLNAAIFLHELGPEKQQLDQIFLEDTKGLSSEQRKFLWKRALETWLEGRTHKALSSVTGDDDPEKNVLIVGVGQFDNELRQTEGILHDLSIPPGMAPIDIAAFTIAFQKQRTALRSKIHVIHAIKERVKARCLNYAIALEKQLSAQKKPDLFLQQVQSEVNNYFKAHCEDVYTKLHKAAQLADSNDPEDCSALLTLVRRSIKAVADFFFPPVSGQVVCSDGQQRALGEEQYLNRLQEYLARLPSASSTELLRAEFNLLAAFSRKLNDISSKGVHASVSGQEAKQGLVGLYMFLYNIVSRLQRVPEGEDQNADKQ